MSLTTEKFYVNSQVPDSIYYNGAAVTSVHYNNKQVWATYPWAGWADASWKDIYDLCKAKQAGTITNYPSDVTLGLTKTLRFSPAYTDTYATVSYQEIDMILIGIDVDGPGVLTFHSANIIDKCSVSGYYEAGQKNGDDSYIYTVSTANNLRTFYNNCEAKNYIKPLAKVSNTYSTTGERHTITQTYPVWLPSAYEISYGTPENERTEGVTPGKYTGYYDRASRRAKTWLTPTSGCADGYFLRTLEHVEGKHGDRYQYNLGYYIDSSGVKQSFLSHSTIGNVAGFAPAFAIG